MLTDCLATSRCEVKACDKYLRSLSLYLIYVQTGFNATLSTNEGTECTVPYCIRRGWGQYGAHR